MPISKMEQITVDFSDLRGQIKPMHGVNSGPFRTGAGLGNMDEFRDAGFPYVRNHDSSACLFYFGERSNDVDFIFRCFDADENDPKNYDFHYTDRFVQHTLNAGASMVFRLGSKIEGGDVKYNVRPPKDYGKYARICEHIIAHYCRGWADGMVLPLSYWEIWCEPENRNCWDGPFEAFLPFYETMAKHLKAAYPELKIGGPGFTGCRETSGRNYPEEFLGYIRERGVPCDFFSWHCYPKDAEEMVSSVAYTRALLNRYGYEKTELVLDEWNYCAGWGKGAMTESYRYMATEEGAAFYAEVLLRAQETALDELLYYDVRPDCSFNGLFAPYVFTPLKGYYAFWAFNKLYALGTEAASCSTSENIAVCAAGNGQSGAVEIAYRKPETDEISVRLCHIPVGKTITCRLTDRIHTNEKIWSFEGTSEEMTLRLPMCPSSIVLLTVDGQEQA
ncbi:MAG: hypothetical protein MJ078_02655 [Clostridia bacterium]|nr:hypothetical protein [Clostridia bacterium]